MWEREIVNAARNIDPRTETRYLNHAYLILSGTVNIMKKVVTISKVKVNSSSLDFDLFRDSVFLLTASDTLSLELSFLADCLSFSVLLSE